MRVRNGGLLATYLKLKESGAPGDFPQVMADVQHKILIEAFRGFPSPWRQYVKISDVSDFKAHHRKWLSEAIGGLQPQKPGGGYLSVEFKDRGYNITVDTKGATFSLLRETVINDDLDAFRKVPAAMGRAAIRGLARKICSLLETNAAAYDGSALFASRGGLARDSVSELTADLAGIQAIQTGIKAIKRATDPDSGEILGAMPKYLLVSPNKEAEAMWLLSQTEVRSVSTASTLTRNPISGMLTPLVEPFLETFPNRWYILADPEITPTIEVAFLDNVQEPEVFVKDSNAIRLNGGGRDEFGYEFDDIEYKVRWDYNAVVALYQGAFKGGN